MSNLPAVFFRNAHGPFQRIDHHTMRPTCNTVPYTGTSTPRINDSAKGAVHNPTTTHTRGGDSCNPYHWRHSVLLNIVHPAHPCPGYLVRAAGCHPSGCHRSGCTRYRKSKMRGNTKPLTHTMKRGPFARLDDLLRRRLRPGLLAWLTQRPRISLQKENSQKETVEQLMQNNNSLNILKTVLRYGMQNMTVISSEIKNLDAKKCHGEI